MAEHRTRPERILIGAEAVGIGRAALERASRYARERIVFGRPIGQNQGSQKEERAGGTHRAFDAK